MKICLNMIVKNEEHCIERCLNSFKHLIDYYVICDTGSTDSTKTLIKNCLSDIKGELFDLNWENFGDTRNKSLALARGKCDYIFLMDADDIFEGDFSEIIDNSFNSYYINMHHANLVYPKIKVISNDIHWKYIGKTHEYLNHPYSNIGFLKKCHINIFNDGNRRITNQKFINDLIILDGDAENTRNVFYKAQTLKDLKCYNLAIKEYEKRIEMGGWQEEVFYSMYMIAECMLYANKYSFSEILTAYIRSYLYNRSRYEPLYKIMYIARNNNMHNLALEFYNIKVNGSNSLFVEPECEKLCLEEYNKCSEMKI